MSCSAVILGSAHTELLPGAQSVTIDTRWGPFELFRLARGGGVGWVSYRHGLPHRSLPHQINYRAQAAALKAVGVSDLLITSSVGVLDEHLPLNCPLLIRDLLWLTQQMPDGSAATMWPEPRSGQGHLVLNGSLFDEDLGRQVCQLCVGLGFLMEHEVVFAYVPGPRLKTKAESRALHLLGAQVNSMSVAPEAVLAAELGIRVAAVGVGHKHSGQTSKPLKSAEEVRQTLNSPRRLFDQLANRFLFGSISPGSSRHHLFTFEEQPSGLWRGTDALEQTTQVIQGRFERAVELSGGALNQVWRVSGPQGSVICKHAPPFVAKNPEIPLTSERARFEATALRRWGGAYDGVVVPRLIGQTKGTTWIEDLGAFPSVESALLEDGFDAGAALARFLSTLHQTEKGAEKLDNSSIQLTRYQVQYKPMAQWLPSVAQEIEQMGRSFLAEGSCWIMGDLWLRSLLVLPDGLGLIDWELTHWGSPAQDLGHLAAHVQMALPGRPDLAEFWLGFREHYSAPLTADQREHLRLHALAEVAMRSVGPFSDQGPWCDLPEQERVLRLKQLVSHRWW